MKYQPYNDEIVFEIKVFNSVLMTDTLYNVYVYETMFPTNCVFPVLSLKKNDFTTKSLSDTSAATFLNIVVQL